MIETVCKDCGQRYRPGTDHVCPKRPTKKSTAARKDVPVATSPAENVTAKKARIVGSLKGQMSRSPEAGTQAPPVDTSKPKDARKGDRHAPGYWSTYMRDRRARLKAEKGTK